MGFVCANAPDGLRVVMTSRTDPPIGLSRLRARGDLAEIRAPDLRFSDDDARALLAEAGLSLRDDQVARLRQRTEGWAAGLYLAGLSLRGREDAGRFIADFAGDDRLVVDYLADEVLEGLPAGRREFLLRTSVLGRLSGPLCDAVAGTSGSARVLAELERSNLFLVPLDNRREWYRYHHLFGELLQHELALTAPGRGGRAAPARGRLAPGRGLGGRRRPPRGRRGRPRSGGRPDRRALVGPPAPRLDRHHPELARAAAARDRPGRRAPLPGRGLAGDQPGAARRRRALAGRGRGVRGGLGRPPARGEHGSPPGRWRASWPGDAPRGAAVRARGPGRHRGRRDLVARGRLPGRRHRPARLRAYGRSRTPSSRSAPRSAGAPAPGRRRSSPSATSPTRTSSAATSTRPSAAPARRWPTRTRRATRSTRTRRAGTPGLAQVLAARGLLDEAQAHADRGAELARRGRAPTEIAYSVIVRGEIALARGDRDLARALRRATRAASSTAPPPPAPTSSTRSGGSTTGCGAARRRRRPTGPSQPTDLTERELAVLRMLTGLASAREIADQLYVSHNTVKTQIKSIYRKLGVATRADAVARGRELGLLAGSLAGGAPEARPRSPRGAAPRCWRSRPGSRPARPAARCPPRRSPGSGARGGPGAASHSARKAAQAHGESTSRSSSAAAPGAPAVGGHLDGGDGRPARPRAPLQDVPARGEGAGARRELGHPGRDEQRPRQHAGERRALLGLGLPQAVRDGLLGPGERTVDHRDRPTAT